MSKLADAEARDLIEKQLDVNLLVEAGAGSGKTHSLSHRMAAGIVSGKYRAEEMAAVTFTRKAAAELRGRFQLALEEKLATAKGEERTRLDAALANLEHLFAGTIHSFCAHLLRERPVEANIAPGFTELDELENDERRRRSWRDYLSLLRGKDSALLRALQQARVSAKDLDRAFRTVCTFDEVEFPAGDTPQPDMKAVRRAADAFSNKLQALMPDPVPPDHKCNTLDKAHRFQRSLRAGGGGRPADLVEALRCWETEPHITIKWWADGPAGRKAGAGRNAQAAFRDQIAQLINEFREATALPIVVGWQQYLYGLVMTLLSGAREFAREERRRALAVNYGDLLTAAANLLRGNRHVRASLQRKYRWLLVDEFQDTDPIQAEVVLLLAADESLEGGAGQAARSGDVDPYKIRLRPGALFVVGDPKQSIYRFRRADIDIYNRVRDAIVTSGGQVVPLTTSFRARPLLCDWNNAVFGTLFPAQATAQQAAFVRLDPDPDWKSRLRGLPPDSPGICTLTIPGDVKKVDHVAAWDADAIARVIRAEVDAGRAAWQDFLVLTRKRKHLHMYAAALESLEIPFEVSGAGAFGGSPAICALIDLLHALGDPADAVAVVGVLRGPLFGINDSDLFAHRQAGGFFTILASHSTPTPKPGRPTPVESALAQLGEFLRLTHVLPLAAAVERILEDSGFLALAAASGPGGAPAGDVLRAVDLVRAAAEDGASLAEAAEFLNEAAKSSDAESVPLEPGRRDVVRVMNLHKAKGLEAAMVFLADPLGGVRKGADVRIVREGGTARGYLTVRKDINENVTQTIAQPPGWDEHEQAELVYVNAEETRLLYVAATRARERLVVSQSRARSSRPWQALDPYLAGAPEISVPERPALARTATVDLSNQVRTQAALQRGDRGHAACRPSWTVTSVTAEAHNTPARTQESSGAASAATAPMEATAARQDAGPEWGSLIHRLLEHAMRHPDVTRADLERLAGWLTVESEDLRPFIPEALDLIQRVVQAPFWQEARASGEAHVEVPFAVRKPGKSPAGPPEVLLGVIDLVYRAPAGWRILDYKTDRDISDEGLLLERHAPQLAEYQGAWERITGEQVESTRIARVR